MPLGESYTDHTARYKSTISNAQLTLQHLLSSTHSNQWKRINNNSPSSSSSTSTTSSTNERLSTTTTTSSESNGGGMMGQVDSNMIKLHKRTSINSTSTSSNNSAADIIRATVEVPLPSHLSEQASKDLLESFKVALKTPQLRPTWDKLVEQSTDLEYLDPRTKVSKTDYRLGWPASPRDTISISRTYNTSSTSLIDLSTSLPRFADEPAFLRPAPPYVRSNVGIYAWCFEIVGSAEKEKKKNQKRMKVSLFWSWNFGGTLNSSNPHLNHIPHLVSSLIGFVRGGGSNRIPSLRSWIQPNETEEGGIELTSQGWDVGEFKWLGEWNVVNPASRVGGEGERERKLEFGLPVPNGVGFESGGGRDGWDVRINVNSSSSSLGGKQYEVKLIKSSSSEEGGGMFGRIRLIIVHPYAPPPPASNDSSISALEGFELGRVSVKCGIMRLVGGKGVRVNGELLSVIDDTLEDSEEEEEEEEEDGKKLNEVLSQLQREEEEEEASTQLETDSLSLLSTSPRSVPNSTSNLLNSSAISVRSNNSASTQSRHQTSHQISTLVRRSYIYFLSLLQEPPQKWRHISDSSSGVTVTQLLSPDPTLTIYRAEAVFVGVGVWDVFATVSTMGVRKTWDRGLDEVKLIRQGTAGGGNGNEGTGNGGELSEVWWEKRKANWPVAPRDSVTLRTSYKSPTSIHIFSSSTDDTTLFPHIPPVIPPTIRTQTDLSGWSIESLSPTTTSITLLDQSDPKGWSNKSSWTPNQLVMDVAGVRDFTIRNGAPPVVTRLNGAKKRELSYDHEKGVFRVEYEAEGMGYDRDSSNEEGFGSEVSSLFEGTSTPRGGGSIESTSTTSTRKPFNLKPTDHHQHQSQPIELELRCDVSVWSPQGLEIMIDPPPSSVSCLSRHRLSSTGGGLWLTIEHPLLIVESSEGKVAITVRKAPKGTNSTPGGVSINGAKVRVDVEVLEDEKVRELEGRKRRKVSPVPLDQYETLGARVWGNGGGDVKKVSLNGMSGEDKKSLDGDVQKKGTSVDGKEEKSTVKGNKAPSIVSIDGSTSSIDPSPAIIDASTITPDPITPISLAKPPLEPPAAALEALAYLQSFHAEQGPELTDPAPGWSIVSERAGTVVRKKMISSVSDVFPVYRGDKIVQGLTADEIASVVTSPGCRKVWDERVDQAIPLASYGNGISTTAISTKPAFPFKGRIFYVSTVVASVKVPSASSTSSTSTVLFVASASYTPAPSSPPGPLDFDPLKANPNSLLSGQVLLEGWILETLDPYTSSVLAIPSTRCTYLANIDQKGSVPLALNQVLNANLAKSIGNVEAFGKTKGPLPRIWNPSNGVQIEGPLSEDGEGDCLWKLGKSGRALGGGGEAGESKVVTANYGDEENTFRALFRVGGKATAAKEEETVIEKAKESRKEQLIKKASSNSTVTNKSLAVGPTLLKSELPRSASLNFGTVAPPVLHKPPITSELSHKRSRSSLRSKSPAAPPVASGAGLASSSSPATPTTTSSLTSSSADLSSNDLVVAELIVDLKQYPHGYSVLTSSSLLTLPDQPAPFDPLSLDPLPPRSLAPSSSSSPTLPLRLTAHDAPLPSILTASLDAWKRANHLVRVLVPTSPITHPLQDPLREPSKTRIEKPEWYKILTEGGGALVEVKIVPLPAPTPAMPNEKERPKLPPGSGSEPTGLGKVTGQANRTVMFNGEKVVVMSQKESRGVLSRFEDEDAPLQGAKISRVPRRKRKASSAPADSDSTTTSSLPLELQQPLAVAVSLLAPKASTPVIDDFEFPDPKSPGMMTPAQEKGGRSPVMSKSGSMQNASSRRGTNSSESTPLTGPLSAILGSYPLARLGSTIVNATTTSTHNPSPTGTTVTKRSYSLGFVIAIAMIAFLLGSFLRSLLTPADYIIYHPISTPSASDSVVEKAILTAIDPHRRWREARRLLELRTGFIGWDIIFAAVKRE